MMPTSLREISGLALLSVVACAICLSLYPHFQSAIANQYNKKNYRSLILQSAATNHTDKVFRIENDLSNWEPKVCFFCYECPDEDIILTPRIILMAILPFRAFIAAATVSLIIMISLISGRKVSNRGVAVSLALALFTGGIFYELLV